MNTKTTIIKIFKEFIKYHPKEFFALFFFLLFEGFIASFSIISIAPLADYLIDPKMASPNAITSKFLETLSYFGIQGNLIIYASFFILSNFLKGIFEIFIYVFVLIIKYKVLRFILSDLIKTTLESRWNFFSKSKKGLLLNTFNREINVLANTLGHLTMQAALFVQVLVYIAIPIWINPTMTLIAILIAVSLTAPFLFLHKLSYKFGLMNTKTANYAMQLISEMFNGARMIIGYSKQKETLINYQNAYDEHVLATIKSQTLTQAIQSLYTPVGILACVVALGISISSGDKLSSSAIVLWSLFRVMPIIGAILKANISISNFIPSFDQINKIKKTALDNRETKGKIKFNEIKKEIRFENVFFKYSNKKIINKLNLKIKKNELTAIIGESGSGKSTFLDLLIGFQEPSQGNIFLDEQNLKDINKNTFRELIGYVPQDPYLFNGSIRDNLKWVNPNATENDIFKACKDAAAEEFIKDLPDGIDTQIGDNAISLSGGQKQRISIARALIKKPKILILDETTSALDISSESEVIKSFLNKRNTTTIIVTHRLSSIIDSDKLYFFHKGSVVEEGVFKTLSGNNKSYLYRMIKKQKN